MLFFYNRAQEEEYENMKFQAGLQGVDLDKEVGKQQTVKTDKGEVTLPGEFMFGDPAENEDLSGKEKKELTDKMMGMHRRWAGNKLKGS